MMALAYGNWETIVNEHVIRAIDIRVNTRGKLKGFLILRRGEDLYT